MSAGRILPPTATVPATSLPAEIAAKAAKAAQEFEAMAIGQMLEPMFATANTAHTAFGGGAGEEAFRPMLVAEMAKHIAAHGGLGLAAPVLAQMLRAQEAPLGGTAQPETNPHEP